MGKAKSSLLRSLIRRCQQAIILENNQELDTDTILEFERSDPYNRRKFIKDSTKTLTIIGLSSVLPFIPFRSNKVLVPPNSYKTKPYNQDPVIAIIGGGIAGLNCAYQLRKSNIIAQIFEADKTTGGRINSKENLLGPGLITEFGGEFIDTNNKDMLDLISELKLEIYDTHADIKENNLIKDAYYFKKQKRTDRDVIHEFRKIVKRLNEDKVKCGSNYNTPFAKNIDNTSLEEYIQSLICSDWFKDLLIYAYVAEFGMDASQQSSINLINMIGTNPAEGFSIFGDSDERFKVKGGNASVTRELSNILIDQIQLGKKLISIRGTGNTYDLSFEDNSVLKADIVVVTLPFTILRNVDIQLDDINKDKLKCIHELGYGQNNKLILSMNNRPWRESGNRHSGYLFHQDIQNGWDSSQMQTNNKGPGSYTIFLGGANSIEMAKASKEQNLRDQVPTSIVNDYISKLDLVFKNMSKAFNGNHSAALWSNNPFVNASYASYSIGQWTSIAGLEMEPIGNVFFAGEHCSTEFQGYMNGGAETGRRVAEAIVKKVKK